VHDLDEAEKHCVVCAKDLKEFGDETSERYEYIPAQLIVIEDARRATPDTKSVSGKESGSRKYSAG